MGLPTPNTRKEQYLNAIATGNAGGLPTPITREEEYLDAIAKSGGGGGEGDMKKSVYDSDLDVANAGGIGAFVDDAVSNKVDKVAGKGLSTNDYDNTEKGKVADNTSAIEAIVNEYGAKNLLLNAATTQEVHGITFTIYGDGSVKANGTASANIWFILTLNDTSVNLPIEQGKDYILSGCPSEGSDDNYYLYVEQYYDGEYQTNKDYGNGVQFKGHSRTKDAVVIYVKSGTVMSNLTFYPMLRDARITDPTYVPYAMTNSELTENVPIRLSKTYTNLVIPTSGYLKIDDIVQFPSPYNEYWLIGLFVGGGSWTFSNSLLLSRGTNGAEIYLFGAPQTITSITVCYIFCKQITAKSIT